MTHKILTFDDLGITSADVFGQMGYQDVMPDEITQGETKAIMEEVRAIVRPEYCYLVMRDLPAFDLGRIILNQLRGSEGFALFIATCGAAFDAFMQRLKEEGDMFHEFIADAMGSVIAEKTADEMEKNLQQSIDKLGWKHTNRFSPGYCGWHVAEQQLLFPLFEGHTCGVRLTDSSLMVPIKSVSGIIGLGKEVSRMDYTCGLCDFKQCFKRKSSREPRAAWQR